ncbi:hypothetical protein KP509_1Z251700 [Ceratopteris richardii]|nr:hypothetical protein KP509_1Z251700 [Ceratopteris richardii]
MEVRKQSVVATFSNGAHYRVAFTTTLQSPLRPLILGGDHSITYPVVRAVTEQLGGPVDILHFDAHPDIYHAFEGNIYSHASSFARIMEGGHARRLLQVGVRSINKEGRQQIEKFGVELFEMRNLYKDMGFLENLVSCCYFSKGHGFKRSKPSVKTGYNKN